MEDSINNKIIIKDLLFLPEKYKDKVLDFFHNANGHKGYFYLGKDILLKGLYLKNLYRSYKFFIEKCIICTQNRKKNIFKKPAIIQIIPNGSKGCNQIDLLELPPTKNR